MGGTVKGTRNEQLGEKKSQWHLDDTLQMFEVQNAERMEKKNNKFVETIGRLILD